MADWRQEKGRTRTRTSADDRRALRETVEEQRRQRESDRDAVRSIIFVNPETGKTTPSYLVLEKIIDDIEAEETVDGDEIPY